MESFFLATLAELLQLQPGGGVGFVFFGVVIPLLTLSTFESNRHSGCFLGHLENLLYTTNMSLSIIVFIFYRLIELLSTVFEPLSGTAT